MRPARLVIAAAAVAALVTPGLSPAAQAAAGSVSYTVHDAQRAEYTLDCTDEPPSHCNVVTANKMYVGITVNDRPRPFRPITVNYQLVNGTAVSGQDFTGTSGTVTITENNQNINVEVPLINDGVAEPSETFTVRITSVSLPGNISDTGTATIKDGNQFPVDCTLTQDLPNETRSLTCTNRPATERWYIVQPWVSIGGVDFDYGNIVTGNGTSTAGWAAYPQAPFRQCLGSTGSC